MGLLDIIAKRNLMDLEHGLAHCPWHSSKHRCLRWMLVFVYPEGQVRSVREFRIRFGFVLKVHHVILNLVLSTPVLQLRQCHALITTTPKFELVHLFLGSAHRQRHLDVVTPGALLLAFSSHPLL